jgi:hypothetical protein
MHDLYLLLLMVVPFARVQCVKEEVYVSGVLVFGLFQHQDD